ncbi:hypothetical protein [Paludibacterium yongneupense]|uniref:hypothetical protein n=1 Tax=Paludibacterium yongneupense TaxID=400061 RepID=UPI0003F992D1|nr:hypothetical protein [Paludibacterium yongneupense]
MYDWNALWHEHQGYRTGHSGTRDDINRLADELGARLIRPAQAIGDTAVYDREDAFLLARLQDGLQLVEVAKHRLFDITPRLVEDDEGTGLAPPYLEIRAENHATAESACWRGAISAGDDGTLLIDGHVLGQDREPAMRFPTLSFNDSADFRHALSHLWREELPVLHGLFASALTPPATERQQTGALHPGDDARLSEICDRYAEIVRREQATLSRLFDDNELHLIAAVLAELHFDSAASCRGLWLAIEARLIDDELDRKWEIDLASLLDRMKTLTYAQEIALIEALTPLDADSRRGSDID